MTMRLPSNSDPVPTDDKRAAAAHQAFWRGLDELEASQPGITAGIHDPVNWHRRELMKLMAASLALAGTPGCSRPPLEQIVPYRQGPPQSIDGKPVFYATAIVRDGYGAGVLVETNMGRPTKIEGNPLHPASLGATDVFSQAAVLELWDRPVAGCAARQERRNLGPIHRRLACAACRRPGRRWFAHPHRNDELSHASFPAPQARREVSPRTMASVPAAQPRQRACRQCARIWRAARAALRVCKNSSRRRARRRFSRQPSRMRSLRAGFCRSPPRDDDKALRCGRNAEFDRRHGRRQASRAQRRDSAARARIGSRAGSRCGPARVGFSLAEDGTKIRICRSCEGELA